jgi:hypothetical protein
MAALVTNSHGDSAKATGLQAASGARLSARRFLAWFFGALGIFSAVLALPLFAFLYAAGELVNVPDVVKHQLARGGLYSSYIGNLEYQHHYALLRARKPDIVALGSSRVGQAAPSFFSGSFVNLTGMLRLPVDSGVVYDDILAAHRPKTIIVGLDHDWFHPDYHLNKGWRRNSRTDWALSVGDLRRLLKLIADRKLTWARVKRILRDDSANLGIQAKLFGEGTDSFGLRHWGSVTFPNAIATAKIELVEARKGSYLFYRGSSINEVEWSAYLDFLRRAKTDGVTVIGYTTPMPPSIVAALEARGGIGWIHELRQRVRALPNHYDFFDVRDLGVTEDGFIDESHAGDRATRIIYERILKDHPL